MSFTALQMFCGGLMLLVPAILHGDLARWNWDAGGLAALAYMTIVSSCIAYTAYAWLSVNVSPAQVGTFGFVNPVVATLLGWWVLDEILTGSQIVGTIVLLLGMVLMNWPRKQGSVTPMVRSGDP
jgi:drug/metabolite transporter (DMT)-like permease